MTMSVEHVCKSVSLQIEAKLRSYGGLGEMSLLCPRKAVADDPMKILVRNRSGQRIAVLLCSSPIAPCLVRRAMVNALLAKKMLGKRLGGVILPPICQGTVDNASYALIPYCRPLYESKFAWYCQRKWMRRRVFSWLLEVTVATALKPDRRQIDREFAAPLRFLARIKTSDAEIRHSVEFAIDRLVSEKWRPMNVLMHNDLWKGNILRGGKRHWSGEGEYQGFVVIDWAGANMRGYGIYDLVRLAQSMGVSDRFLAKQVVKHCHVLGCESRDSVANLMAGLGHLAMHLEHFPVEQFERLLNSCFATLSCAVTCINARSL